METININEFEVPGKIGPRAQVPEVRAGNICAEIFRTSSRSFVLMEDGSSPEARSVVLSSREIFLGILEEASSKLGEAVNVPFFEVTASLNLRNACFVRVA